MLLTLAEAAKRLSMNQDYLGKIIREGRIRAVKVSRDWLIDPDSLNYRRKRRGRKKKEQQGGD